MLLPSGDDAASAIAMDTVGMARFCRRHECAGRRHSVSPSRLHGDRVDSTIRGSTHPPRPRGDRRLHVPTVPLFDQIVGTRTITLPAGIEHPAFHLHNLDALLGPIRPRSASSPGGPATPRLPHRDGGPRRASPARGGVESATIPRVSRAGSSTGASSLRTAAVAAADPRAEGNARGFDTRCLGW